MSGRPPAGAGALSGALVTLTTLTLGCQPPPDAPPPVVAPLHDGGVDATPSPRDAGAPGLGDAPPGGADAHDGDAAVPGSTVLHVRVHDAASGKPLPAKIFLRDAVTNEQLHFGNFVENPVCMGMAASLRELGSGGALATWNGVALWNGEARIPIGTAWEVPGNGCPDSAGVLARRQGIPFGRYLVVAARGLEYELTTAEVDLGPGRGEVSIDLPLSRTVDTRGYLAADMHIHSGSPTARAPGTAWSRPRTA